MQPSLKVTHILKILKFAFSYRLSKMHWKKYLSLSSVKVFTFHIYALLMNFGPMRWPILWYVKLLKFARNLSHSLISFLNHEHWVVYFYFCIPPLSPALLYLFFLFISQITIFDYCARARGCVCILLPWPAEHK